MASDVVAPDKVINIQFIKWRPKPLSKLLGEETLYIIIKKENK